jgi:predicted dehydrogenase
MSVLRVGILGMGKMGTLHLAGWNRVPGTKVVATMDHSGNVADLGSQVDLCVVATPTPDHVASAVALIRSGVHCLVEKPLAPTEKEARVVTEAARQQGVFIGVGHTERFNPSISRAMAMLRTPVRAHGTCFADVQRDAGPSRQQPSSNVVLDLMVHDIDWVLHALDEMPEDIAVRDARVRGGALTAVRCELRFSEGRSIRLSANHEAVQRRRAAVMFPDTSARSVVNLDAPASASDDDAVTKQARAFLAALSGAPSDIATGDDAVRTAAVTDALHAQLVQRWSAPW